MKNKFSKILKRIILVTLLVVVLIVGCVYFFDQYKPSISAFENEYSDEYWNQETIEGFTYYDEVEKIISVKNYGDKTNYKYPWEPAYNKQGDGLTYQEKLTYARYAEEFTKIKAEILQADEDEAKELNKQLTNDFKEFLYAADFPCINLRGWQREVTKVTSTDIEGLTSTFTNVVDFVKSLKADLTKETIYYELKYFAYINQYELNGREKARNLVSIIKRLTNVEITADQEKELVYLANNDDEFKTYLLTDTDDVIKGKEPYQNILNQISVVEARINEVESFCATIQDEPKYKVQWKDYLETGFMEKALTKDAGNGNKYELWFNPSNTAFSLKLVDSANNVLQTWDSNPDAIDPNPNFTGSMLEINKKSQLIVHYSKFAGASGEVSTYEYSVATRNPKRQAESLVPTYGYKIVPEENKIIVTYHLTKRGLTFADFPRYITKERFDEVIKRNDLFYKVWTSSDTELQANLTELNKTLDSADRLTRDDIISFQTYYKETELITLDDIKNDFKDLGLEYYELTSYNDKMSRLTINLLNKIFYKICNYTTEDLEYENDQFSQRIELSNPDFKIAIEYELTEDGLSVLIPGNSVIDTPDYPVTYVEVLPYFTSTVAGIEGYTVIPDGSGAIMNHDNGNTFYAGYTKRIYSKDLNDIQFINKGAQEELLLPLYGVINPGNDSGLLVHATKGASLLELSADISGKTDSYNKNFFKAYFRESAVVTVGTASYERKELIKWTDKQNKNDIEINYVILNHDELSYSGLAKRYREFLIESYDLTEKDTTSAPTLDMDILGSYSYRENFIGVPYTEKKSLTTINQLNEIVKTFKDVGIENINAFYRGWRKEGLVNTSFKSIKLSSLNGSKEAFKRLLEVKDNVAVYPYVSFGELDDFQESFGSVHYVSHSVDGRFSSRYPYDLNSNVFNQKKGKIYAISPRYYLAFAKELADNYTKLTNGQTLAIEKLGSGLAGDYKKGIEAFKSDAINEQIKSLAYLDQKGVSKLTLFTPYDYAFKYVSVAKNIPFQTTRYEIIDYSVPFYQLVVNGLFDYSGISFNSISEKGANEYLMRLIETGSNIAYTFSYDSSKDLIQTDYNNYYYTQYTDWVSDVESMFTELSNLGIYDARLVSHERIANEVYKVTYKNASKTIVIYLNYNRTTVTVDGGISIAPKSYVVA